LKGWLEQLWLHKKTNKKVYVTSLERYSTHLPCSARRKNARVLIEKQTSFIRLQLQNRSEHQYPGDRNSAGPSSTRWSAIEAQVRLNLLGLHWVRFHALNFGWGVV